MDSKVKEMIAHLEEQIEALVIAIPKEESAYLFYRDLANSTRYGSWREMFERLADQELGHKRSLEKILEDIQMEMAKLKAEK